MTLNWKKEDVIFSSLHEADVWADFYLSLCRKVRAFLQGTEGFEYGFLSENVRAISEGIDAFCTPKMNF